MRPKQTWNLVRLSFKSTTALLILASAFLVEAQTLQTLCSFSSTNGAYPYAGLTLGSDGNFYGTTGYGGSSNAGTVFKLTTNGTLTTLICFNSTNGANPPGALTLGNDANFYGTTAGGGSSAGGTVFQVTTNGALTTLVFFTGNGTSPNALTLGNDGNFYGTTYLGGIQFGTVFRVTTNGTLTTLVSFNSTNGAWPEAALTLGSDGNFYGTTCWGGSSNEGTVFMVTTNGGLTTLVSFSGPNGAYPYSGLTLGNDGNFYGTTEDGGGSSIGGVGTVFQVTTNGALTTLYWFTGGTNGEYPHAGLTLGNDGNFYGTTWQGGITNSTYRNGMGTLFQVTTNGTLTTLVYFNLTNGAYPQTALRLGNDGNFYGTTEYGGNTISDPYGMGTVFRLSLTPVITVQPHSQTSNVGVTATFAVSATGLNPMAYQWQKNGTNLVNGSNISGATTKTLAIKSISNNDAASYSVVVSYGNSSVTSSIAVLTVNDLPFIASQPQSQTVSAGSNVTFSVTVYGAPPFVFQWYFKGIPLGSPATGTNLSSCTLTNVGTNQAGNYSVDVFNGYGSVTSSNATLTVVVPPIITTQPMNRTNNVATPATFSVVAASASTLSYQWQKNGTNLVNAGKISGATSSTLTINGVSDSDAANYSVTVTNLAGSDDKFQRDADGDRPAEHHGATIGSANNVGEQRLIQPIRQRHGSIPLSMALQRCRHS